MSVLTMDTLLSALQRKLMTDKSFTWTPSQAAFEKTALQILESSLPKSLKTEFHANQDKYMATLMEPFQFLWVDTKLIKNHTELIKHADNYLTASIELNLLISKYSTQPMDYTECIKLIRNFTNLLALLPNEEYEEDHSEIASYLVLLKKGIILIDSRTTSFHCVTLLIESLEQIFTNMNLLTNSTNTPNTNTVINSGIIVDYILRDVLSTRFLPALQTDSRTILRIVRVLRCFSKLSLLLKNFATHDNYTELKKSIVALGKTLQKYANQMKPVTFSRVMQKKFKSIVEDYDAKLEVTTYGVLLGTQLTDSMMHGMLNLGLMDGEEDLNSFDEPLADDNDLFFEDDNSTADSLRKNITSLISDAQKESLTREREEEDDEDIELEDEDLELDGEGDGEGEDSELDFVMEE